MKKKTVVIGKLLDTPKTLVCQKCGDGIDVHICKNGYIGEGFTEMDDELLENEIALLHFSSRKSMEAAITAFVDIYDNWEKINPESEKTHAKAFS